MKIAIVVGHNSRAQGAVRVTDGVSEYVWNTRLAELIRSHDPASVKIFKRTAGGGYSAEIDRVYAEVNAWGADCSIELHFNAAGSSAATGGETLSSGSDGSLRLANGVRKAVRDALGLPDRGVKIRSRTDRGGRSLWQGRAPAALAEPYFGSNANDCAAADLHMDALAEAYYRAAVQFLGGDVAASKPAPEPEAPTDSRMQAILADLEQVIATYE